MGKLTPFNNIDFSCSIYEKKTYKDNKHMDGSKFSNLISVENYENEIKDFFKNFYDDVKNSKRGLFIYGKSGVGKTHLIKEYLKKYNYDPIFYEPHEQRNKSSLLLDNMSNTRVNVLNMFKKEQKKVVIVIDEIENMNNGDKTGITSLIKSLKIKKNKKKDVKNVNPIICISSTNSEKKIKELMDVCHVINIDKQDDDVIEKILLNKIGFTDEKIVNIVSGNLHKLKVILEYFSLITSEKERNYKNKLNNDLNNELNNELNSNNIFIDYFFDSSESTKEIVHKLYTNNYTMNYHKKIISDNDRTIINLIWHENIGNILNEIKSTKNKLLLYKRILDNICIGDLMDRVIFQNQIWHLGEYSSLLKTFYNNWIIHSYILNSDNGTNKKISYSKIQKKTIEFTKVLTKYSTEYNNNIFITRLCEKLFFDKKDLFWFFANIVKNEEDNNCSNPDFILDSDEDGNITDAALSIHDKLNNYEITKLDINRMKKIISYILGET